MANKKHLELVKRGADTWNAWRKKYSDVAPDLSQADLSNNKHLENVDLSGANLSGAFLSGAFLFDANLSRANLSRAIFTGAMPGEGPFGPDIIIPGMFTGINFSFANLTEACLIGAYLHETNFTGANLTGANLTRAHLSRANLTGAHLSRANLSKARLDGTNFTGANLSEVNFSETDLSGINLSGINLSRTDLSGANLSGANLSGANLSYTNLGQTILIGTNLANATLKDCNIYGISAWDVHLDGAEQLNLTITPEDQPTITVDNLKIAQFIYLILNNAEIRDVINTLTTKAVLILGRFTPERKAVLDALRDTLREHNYLPILFDFDPAKAQTVRETIRTLAHLSHFIIADLSDPSSIPEELETIVPTLAVPVQPLLEITHKQAFSMFKGYGLYSWVLPIYRYTDLQGLVNNIQEKVIAPATQKAQELADKKGHLNQEPFEQTT